VMVVAAVAALATLAIAAPAQETGPRAVDSRVAVDPHVGMDPHAEVDPRIEVVRAVDGRSVPCPALGRSRSGEPTGGCLVRGTSQEMGFYVLTVVEEMWFSRCYVSFELRVDGRGRTALSDLGVGGRSPCNDVLACYRGDGEAADRPARPWRGRVVSDEGGLAVRLGACLDTCMGRFGGRLDVALRQSRDGWRATARDAPVGTSGWRFDGGWELATPPGFDVRRPS
jgi:hypothetical protein